MIEIHPLEPFLPENAKLLMLGSFPPQRKRWSMDFYYPNLNNDMWRIMGIIFFANKNYFLEEDQKAFCKSRIMEFAKQRGVALYDTAYRVHRLQDNASDKFLEIVEPADVKKMLKKLPFCKAVVTTGQKATDIIREQFEMEEPAIGRSSVFCVNNRVVQLYRMPSSSRAYPLSLDKKAEFYRKMFRELSIID